MENIKYSTETGYDIDRYRKFYLKEYNNDYKKLEALNRQFADCNETIADYNDYLEEEKQFENKKAEFKSISIIDGAIAGIGLAILGVVSFVAPEFKFFAAMIAGSCVTPTAILELYAIIAYIDAKTTHNINVEVYDEEDAIAAENAKKTIINLRKMAKGIIDRMNKCEEHLNYLDEYAEIYRDIVKDNAHITGNRSENKVQEKRELSVPRFVLKSDPYEIMPAFIINGKRKKLSLIKSLND